MYKDQIEMPTEGKFVMIWNDKNKGIRSATYYWINRHTIKRDNSINRNALDTDVEKYVLERRVSELNGVFVVLEE